MRKLILAATIAIATMPGVSHAVSLDAVPCAIFKASHSATYKVTCTHLSMEEKLRVAQVKTLAHDAEVVFDEPTRKALHEALEKNPEAIREILEGRIEKFYGQLVPSAQDPKSHLMYGLHLKLPGGNYRRLNVDLAETPAVLRTQLCQAWDIGNCMTVNFSAADNIEQGERSFQAALVESRYRMSTGNVCVAFDNADAYVRAIQPSYCANHEPLPPASCPQ